MRSPGASPTHARCCNERADLGVRRRCRHRRDRAGRVDEVRHRRARRGTASRSIDPAFARDVRSRRCRRRGTQLRLRFVARTGARRRSSTSASPRCWRTPSPGCSTATRSTSACRCSSAMTRPASRRAPRSRSISKTGRCICSPAARRCTARRCRRSCSTSCAPGGC